MLALPHSLDELDFLTNPEEDFWTPLNHVLGNDEGWTFVLQDFDNWRTTFGEFWFFVAVEKETKRPISCIILVLDEASVNGEDPLYSMGYYYTDPEWRGAGVGSKLFWMLMATVGDHNIAMNSAFEMVPRYITMFGADQFRDYYIKRAEIQLKDIAPPQKAKGLVAKELHEVEWRDVAEYDVKVTSRKREKYLRKLLEPSDEVFARIVLNDKGNVVGFGSLRVEIGGSLGVGPLYADNKDAARLILDTVMPLIDKEKYTFMEAMYPSCNPDAERVMIEVSGGKLDMAPYAQPQFTKHVIPVDDLKVFSVTEIGISYI